MADHSNQLGAESSPYLLQHKDNPVHWLPWGDEAFEIAKKEDKPVLLSIGYAACHWCHVMAHESFESDEIAAQMNEQFVNIKVDREERPDIDSIYMSAINLMGEQGGWPLTVFLTPDGEPYWGGTYFPPKSRYGRPGFPEVLKAMANVYHDQKDKVIANTTALKEALDGVSAVKDTGRGGLTSVDELDGLAADAVRMIDPLRGGTVGAPKFPQPTFLQFFWRAYKRTGNENFKNATLISLIQMCQGGIYDHLGGGFARYSTDEVWLVPHFEKMLYDNAQLAELMTLVWQETDHSILKVRIAETIDWVLRDLGLEGGGLAGTLDADSEGVEGKFYVWSESEIDEVLGEESEFFKTIYDVSADGNWEGSTILNRTRTLALGSEADEARLKAAREKLLAVRDKRIWPGLDDKVLADWNGMM
ncbi:MAG: thioredoxin domain-containing protein, partial [Rhodospirillaceae bacterium]